MTGWTEDKERMLWIRAERLERLVKLGAPHVLLIEELRLLMSLFTPRWIARLWADFASRKYGSPWRP